MFENDSVLAIVLHHLGMSLYEIAGVHSLAKIQYYPNFQIYNYFWTRKRYCCEIIIVQSVYLCQTNNINLKLWPIFKQTAAKYIDILKYQKSRFR